MTAQAACSCHAVRPLLETYIDGELSPDKLIEVEQHTEECALCGERVRLMYAFRQSTQIAVRRSVDVSDAFRGRVLAALAAEQAREEEHELRRSGGRPLGWQTIAPLAIAAGFALVFGALKSRDTDDVAPSETHNGSVSDKVYTAASVDQLIEQLLDYHASSGTPEVTEPSLIQGFEPQVGVPVRLPSLQGYGAHWEGGSVIPMRSRHANAASFRYRLNGHRLTVYVYDARRLPLRDRLEPQVVHDAPVFVGTRRGYSIAAVERRGVGYALATDLALRKSAELVASIH